MDFEGVVGTVGQDVPEVRFRKVRPVDGDEGLVRAVFREVADPENADLGEGGFHFHPEIVLSGHAEDVLESVLQTEIIRSQDQGGGASLLDPEIRADVEEALGRGIQRELLGADPFRSLPGTLPGAQQAGLEAGLGFVRAAVLVPDGEFHPVTHLGLQGRSAIADALGTPVFHASAVPHFAAVAFAGDLQAPGGLGGAAPVRLHPPAEVGLPVFDGDGFMAVLDPEVRDACLGGRDKGAGGG